MIKKGREGTPPAIQVYCHMVAEEVLPLRVIHFSRRKESKRRRQLGLNLQWQQLLDRTICSSTCQLGTLFLSAQPKSPPFMHYNKTELTAAKQEVFCLWCLILNKYLQRKAKIPMSIRQNPHLTR